MTRRGTFLLFALALVVIAWLVFLEPNQQLSADAPLFHFDPNKVTLITITDGNESHVLTRRNEDWDISTLPPDHADAQEVQRLLTAASEVKPLDILTSKELKKQLSLSSLGLQHPKRSIMIHEEGAKDQTLYVGNEAVGEKRLFARLNNQKSVVIISSALADLAFRPSDDFRDHHLTSLDASHLEQLILRQGLGKLQLVLENQQWKMTEPTMALISSNALASWINPLLQAPILTRVANDEGDLAPYGLDQPRAEITLLADGSTNPIILSLGNTVERKEHSEETPLAVYLRSSTRHSIFKIAATLAPTFMISPDMLRERHLFKINLDTVDRIEIVKPGVTLSLRRQTGESENWIIDGSNAPAIPGAEMQKIIESLQKTNVTAFQIATPTQLSAAGLDSSSTPSATIRFIAHLSENIPDANAGDRIVMQIVFGKPNGTMLFARVGDAPELVQIPSATLDLFSVIKP